MKTLNKCLVCGGERLTQVIDLGMQPLANNYLPLGQTQEKYPLALNYCQDCTHSQLSFSVDPDTLYSNYLYVSGTTATLRDWFYNFSQRFSQEEPGSILDIAGNDGSLLTHFKGMKWNVTNIDPAKNLRQFNKDLGIPIITEFWSEKLAKDSGVKFDVITAFNVIAHTRNPLDLVKGIKEALKDNGRAYIMTSQADMLRAGQFDTIYHEHHSFFTEESMRLLLEKAGFKDWQITFTRERIHGGSMMVEVARPYQKFVSQTNRTLEFLKTVPESAIGYGAAAKGVVMLNSSGLKLRYVVDENKLKHDTVIPGTEIPIVSPKLLLKEKKDLVIVILAWNFADEIISKVKKLRPKRHDTFYIPFPWAKVIGGKDETI